MNPVPFSSGVVVLGIDPGLAHCGWGAVKWQPGLARAEALAWGVIETPPGPVLPRVRSVTRAVDSLITRFEPYALAAEEWLAYEGKRQVGHGTDTLRVVGAVEALAVIRGITYSEFPATTLKKTLTGAGSGSKKVLAVAVQKRLGMDSLPTPDHASDALGIALVALLELRASLRVSEKGKDCLNNMKG